MSKTDYSEKNARRKASRAITSTRPDDRAMSNEARRLRRLLDGKFGDVSEFESFNPSDVAYGLARTRVERSED